MIDQFHELLNRLGERLNVSLHPDKKGACTLVIRNAFSVQMEYDPSRERILIGSFVCEIPPGKLRENVMRDALKSHVPYPELGTFGYSERNNKLSLFLYIPLNGLTGEKCAALLTTFVDKIAKWKEAISLGTTSTLVQGGNAPELKPFGLKP
jgi:Tir chaperone protein (CesT) family